MSAKYIFRLDDIAENMNWTNFFKLKKVFIENQVKPIIGVIPDNQDEELLKYPQLEKSFWSLVRRLQQKEGWIIALHGDKHVYETNNSGILKINKRSEYAGLTKEEQNQKIINGIKKFEQEQLKIDAFMAPAHSFDEVTLECLVENNINVVTDGYALFPYTTKDVLFVPQLFAKPRKMPIGIYTWCLHLNTMTPEDIDNIIEFITTNKDDIISFNEAKQYEKSSVLYKVQNGILSIVIKSIRKLKG